MGVHVPHDVILKPKRKRSTMEVHVPHDVILNHILPRIPAKSACRFRCVSKEWHSFLMSKMFENMHIVHQKNNLKLLVISKSETTLFEFMFTIIDCEAPPTHDKGLTPTSRPLPQFEDVNPHSIRILASIHGLVCLGIHEIKSVDVYSHLILWNPLSNEYKRLPKFNYNKYNNDIWHSDSDFGLYYSSCEDDYKLLFVNYENHVYNYEEKKNVYIYSLKLDSWRKVADFQHTGELYPGHWSRGTYLNENIYFLQEHSRPNGRLSSIMRFNTKTERLSQIETPSVDDYPKVCNYFATIMVKSDCIHVCVKYDIAKMSYDEYGNMKGFGTRIFIKLWKLDENGNMKEVVSYQLLKRPNVYDHAIIIHLIPFHLMKNGNWLMRDRSNKHQIYKVDLKKKTQINDKGKGKEEGNIYDDFEYAEVRVDDKNNDIVDVEGRYIETFVSPNRYMK